MQDMIDTLLYTLFRYRTMRSRLIALKDVKQRQCADGTWNYDAYMHGLANGLTLALHTMEDDNALRPAYKRAPKHWGRDIAKLRATETEKSVEDLIKQHGKC